MELRRIHIILIITLTLSWCTIFISANGATSSNSNSNLNPYSVLGVQKSASQDEIKKKYRSLCLKYHPDKNVNSSEKEKEKCEKQFKQIQEANSLIGTKEDRSKYDSMSAFQRRYYGNDNYGPSSSSSSSQQASAEEAFRQFFRQGGGDPFSQFSRRGYGHGHGHRFRRPRRAFYVNGVDISHFFDQGGHGMNPFSSGGDAAARQAHEMNPNAPKSIFIEKVTVPLEDLYNGVGRREFQLQDHVFQKYTAAFRGGIASQLGLQSFLTSLPLLFRASWQISFLGFLAAFHLSLPHPNRLLYYSHLKAGWKGGTKLKFAGVEPGVDVVFILDEGKHDRFERDGNDLKTNISIGKSKAQKGCTLFFEPLGINELPITVKLKRGEITENHQVVTVKGRGWPMSGGGKGDLKIIVSIVSDVKADRLRRKKSKRRKT